MEKMSSIGFSVLAFARPDGLLACIQSIKRYAPGIPIVVSIDRFLGDDENLSVKNLETIEVASRLLERGEIVEFFVSDFNLKTKAAWFWAMKNSFNHFDYSIYFEDDLRLVSQPISFLEGYLSTATSSDKASIATLYSSRIHAKDNGTKDFTSWPELWGVVMSEHLLLDFENFCTIAQSRDSIQGRITDWADSNLSPLGRAFKPKFQRFWTWKFHKAFLSDTAWDTLLHYFIWYREILVMIPKGELIRDTGVDVTSVSKLKIAQKVKGCVNPFPFLLFKQKNCWICKLRKELLTILA